MIFATVFFILLCFRYIFKGMAFHQTLTDWMEMSNKKSAGIPVDTSKMASTLLPVALYVICAFIAKTIYLFYAYDIDIYKWPTIIYFAYYIGSLILTRTSNQYYTLPYPKWSVSGVLTTIASIGYLTYILLLLLNMWPLLKGGVGNG